MNEQWMNVDQIWCVALAWAHDVILLSACIVRLWGTSENEQNVRIYLLKTILLLNTKQTFIYIMFSALFYIK